ncbi:MAG: bifunctional nuclease domain-containing protein [Bacteroidota bacterium]
MKKVELELLALSESNTSVHAYAVVLGEKGGMRKLPIIIGSFEAQAIAIELEKMKPARPLTHDLLLNFARAFDLDLQEVIITDLREGVYFANLVWINAKEPGKEWILDARTSDALALAVRFGCPIYTVESVLTQGAVDASDAEAFIQPSLVEEEETPYPSLEALEQELQEALKEEDYEKAARIRDRIQNRRKSRGH